MIRCTDCNRPVKPVVALDIDGTLGDYHGHFLTFAEGWLGTQGNGWALTYDGSEDLAKYMGIDKYTYRQIKLAYRQGGLKRTMPPFGDVAQATDQLRQAGAEVWLTTTRPYLRLDNLDPDTRFWLDQHDVYYDGLIYDELKYRRLHEIVGGGRIVCVMDDLPDLLDQAEEIGLPWLQMHTRYNSAIRRTPGAATLAGAVRYMQTRIEAWHLDRS
jgi:hypothetical protein